MIAEEKHFEAMDKIGALVSIRERTCSELRERLRKSGFEPDVVEEAVDTAVRCGLVDEERYTRAYIRGKSHMGWGKSKIVRKLEESGIDWQTIESCEDEFPDEDDELEMALKELAKRPSNSKNQYASYMRRLVGKGYSYDTASRAVKAFLNE